MKNISIDWLQLSCSGNYLKSKKYKYKLLDYGTRVFKYVEEIYIKKEIICSIAYCPLSSILKNDLKVIKFENRVLYRHDLFVLVDNIIKDHGLKLNAITRLDLAVDFNNFTNNLKPENLISKFVNNEYLRVNKGKYKIIGEQLKFQKFEYLRFGTNSSDIAVYLYNKSVEMQQRKFKQHIYDKWLAQELDVKEDVWRLEISIKGNDLNLLEKDTGLIIKYEYELLKDYMFIENLFRSLLYRFFRFKINDGTSNKSRMKDVVLFDKNSTVLDCKFLTETKDYNRMNKIFIKMMENFNCEVRERKSALADLIDKELLIYSSKRRLMGFYMNKVKNNY